MKSNNVKKRADIATIGNTAARCREEGIPVGEKTLRRWVDEGSFLPSAPGARFWFRGRI